MLNLQRKKVFKMILKKYLDEFYYNLVVDSYDEVYLDTLDENNFIKI